MNTNTVSAVGAMRVLSKTQKRGRIDMLPLVTLRFQSSYRRTRSRLNIKPDPSFLPSKTEAHDHIIYNPPPSAPNVYHTPTIFLPKTDRRRQLHEEAALKYPHLASAAPAELPPPVRTPYEKRYHLTAEDMEEMRRLRREDPIEWSATKLARKFDTSNLFVGFVTDGIATQVQVGSQAANRSRRSSASQREMGQGWVKGKTSSRFMSLTHLHKRVSSRS